MNRIRDALARAKDTNRTALVGYLTAGDPSLDATSELLVAMAEGGADVIEVGVPFSDPTADGPVIQRASERALRGGATVRGVLDAVERARRRTDVPIVLFGYANPFLRYGAEALARDAKKAEIDGLLVVDLPPEECAVLATPAARAGIAWVPLVAPNTPPARVAHVVGYADAFLYFVSATGVTGAKVDLALAGARAVAIAREHQVPVAVGFGVSTADDVRTLAGAGVDAVVVGSAFMRAIEASADVAEATRAVKALAQALSSAGRRGG